MGREIIASGVARKRACQRFSTSRRPSKPWAYSPARPANPASRSAPAQVPSSGAPLTTSRGGAAGRGRGRATGLSLASAMPANVPHRAPVGNRPPGHLSSCLRSAAPPCCAAAAAREGPVMGLPSFAISLVGRGAPDFGPAAASAAQLASEMGRRGLPPGTLLNVNVPPGRPGGARITRLGKRSYSAAVVQKLDPPGRAYYWVGGGGPGPRDTARRAAGRALHRGAPSIAPRHLRPAPPPPAPATQ